MIHVDKENKNSSTNVRNDSLWEYCLYVSVYKFAIVFKPKSVNAGPDLDPEQQTATYFAIFNVVRSELEQKKRLLCFIVTHYFPLCMPLFP